MAKNKVIVYRIGGHLFALSDTETVEAVERIRSFEPFVAGDAEGALPEFEVGAYNARADEATFPDFEKPLYRFYYEEVESCFGTAAGGYLLTLQPDEEDSLSIWMRPDGKECLWQGNPSPRLMRFAVWTAYGVMTAQQGTVAIHSSCIVYGGKAYLFLGESGTGKSTHTRLWREHIEGSRLLNDDSPIVRCEADGVYVYGSPWSGKTPCYRAERYPLGGCVRLSQAPYNEIRRLGVLHAFGALHPSAPPAFAYDNALYDGITETLGKVLEQVPVWHLACLPDKAAAELSCSRLHRESE